ncbi:LOB domain-containing protein 20-like isoform X2 [Hevea brasiliensis]|uniref:LOB domain-containing protein 20-like isoform X2 n=1 Tax=Hevea brasiliensis TaxID=3981 RepID=UPI0025DFEF49|nr:LOB domain-containing protein 20-like isoform X2 [Hevea brasiliensis]
MADPECDATSDIQRKVISKHASAMPVELQSVAGPVPVPAVASCGACKFLRRKCLSGCIFAPHFGSDQGAARFAAVHKVFGASNVSKLLLHIPMNQRHEAVVTISYEAQARLSDPVYGCVSTILALQQQVASLQAELAMVQTQLINSRFEMANVLQNSQQQQQLHHYQHLQPAYSNNSSACTNLINMSSFTSNFDLVTDTAPSSHSLEPLQHSRPSHDGEDDEEQSRIFPAFLPIKIGPAWDLLQKYARRRKSLSLMDLSLISSDLFL